MAGREGGSSRGRLNAVILPSFIFIAINSRKRYSVFWIFIANVSFSLYFIWLIRIWLFLHRERKQGCNPESSIKRKYKVKKKHIFWKRNILRIPYGLCATSRTLPVTQIHGTLHPADTPTHGHDLHRATNKHPPPLPPNGTTSFLWALACMPEM